MTNMHLNKFFAPLNEALEYVEDSIKRAKSGEPIGQECIIIPKSDVDSLYENGKARIQASVDERERRKAAGKAHPIR